MTKPRKRFSTEEQILAAIDRAHGRQAKYAKRAEELEQEAKRLKVEAAALGPNEDYLKRCQLLDAAKDALKGSDKQWKRSFYVREKALPRLGVKLSEFRTAPMFTGNGCGDSSVPQ